MVTPARPFGEFVVGEAASLERHIGAEDVARWVEFAGDDNPLHVDDADAEARGLPRAIVHGMLTTSFISTVIGTQLPGPGALELSLRLAFRRPVFVGDTIRVEVRIRRTSPATRVLTLDLNVRNGRGETVLDGEAQVQVLYEVAEVT